MSEPTKIGVLLPVAMQNPQALPACSTHSEVSLLSPLEREILNVKYAAPPISFMTIADVITWSKVLLVKIAAITGWPLPQDERLLVILVDQFSKKLREEYRRMNASEIEYAFRNYASRTENYGSELSIILCDKVLHTYLEERYLVSKVEERLPALTYNAEVTLDEFLQTIFNWYKLKGFMAIPTIAYDILEREGLIRLTSEEKQQIMRELLELHNVTDRYIAKAYAVKKFFDQNEQRFTPIQKGSNGPQDTAEAGS